jgi:hypothetical protein
MKSKVIQLPTRKAAVQQSIIETLEEALDRAREGEFESVAVSVIYADGSSGCFTSLSDGLSALIGSTFETTVALTAHKLENGFRLPERPKKG